MVPACEGPSGPPSVVPPIDDPPLLVGAGNIATCDGNNDEATAKLLDSIPGQVFTTGDNAFPSGSARDYDECYGPGVGRCDSLRERHCPPQSGRVPNEGRRPLAGGRKRCGP